MLSDRELETALARIEWRMDKLNTLYLEQVGEQVNAIGRLSPTSVNRLIQMRKAGASMDKINAELRRATGKNTTEIGDLYKQAMQETYADYEFMPIARGCPLVPLEYNTPLQRVLEAEAHETRRTMSNLSNTTNMSARYREIVSDAVQAAATGVADYHSAMRSALRQVAEDGPRVTYESGVQRRLDTAIRMNVVDGVKHIQQQAQHIIGVEIGADGIEISAHPHSAPDHEPVQGRQFRHEEFEKLQTGGACRDYDGNYYVGFQRPIGEWNCRHFAFDIVLGIARRQHSDEELARWQKENEQGCTIDGQHYSIYEAGQLMRKIETAIRRQKDVATVARASGDDVLRRQAQKKISDLTAAYKRVSDASGLQTRAQRLYVSGFKDVKLLKNAAGHDIIEVKKTLVTGEPNSITQIVHAKGGIDRNYYGLDGTQTKQISNNNHGSPKAHPYGNHGEHAHDYVWENGALAGRPARELTEDERKENADIL